MGYATLILRLIPVINVINALLPLVRKPDDLSDIPLTASQRKLLGLAPSSAPPTPGSVYSTPPRYARTPSVGGSPASLGSFTGGGAVGGGYGSSPLSGREGSPGTNGNNARLNGSPLGGSPLSLQKSIGSPLAGLGLNGGQRRSSFGSPSSLGGGPGTPKGGLLLGDLGSGTPSPTAGKRSSVGLNSKWLYDRGRRSSGGVKPY
jgi:nucleoporin POM34